MYLSHSKHHKVQIMHHMNDGGLAVGCGCMLYVFLPSSLSALLNYDREILSQNLSVSRMLSSTDTSEAATVGDGGDHGDHDNESYKYSSIASMNDGAEKRGKEANTPSKPAKNGGDAAYEENGQSDGSRRSDDDDNDEHSNDTSSSPSCKANYIDDINNHNASTENSSAKTSGSSSTKSAHTRNASQAGAHDKEMQVMELPGHTSVITSLIEVGAGALASGSANGEVRECENIWCTVVCVRSYEYKCISMCFRRIGFSVDMLPRVHMCVNANTDNDSHAASLACWYRPLRITMAPLTVHVALHARILYDLLHTHSYYMLHRAYTECRCASGTCKTGSHERNSITMRRTL